MVPGAFGKKEGAGVLKLGYVKWKCCDVIAIHVYLQASTLVP